MIKQQLDEGELFVAGEDIPAGSGLRVGEDLKLYAMDARPGYYQAGESLREGFRVSLRPDAGKAYEDDA